MTKADIVSLLSSNLATLTYRNRTARVAVVAWYVPANMQKDYLQNEKADVLISVKEAESVSSRFLSTLRVPYTRKTQFEVGVWLLDSPSYTRGEKDVLRDAAVAEVQRIFKANPTYGCERGVRNDDHVYGKVWVLSSIVTVQSITESTT
jgi:hypothetical protein